MDASGASSGSQRNPLTRGVKRCSRAASSAAGFSMWCRDQADASDEVDGRLSASRPSHLHVAAWLADVWVLCCMTTVERWRRGSERHPFNPCVCDGQAGEGLPVSLEATPSFSRSRHCARILRREAIGRGEQARRLDPHGTSISAQTVPLCRKRFGRRTPYRSKKLTRFPGRSHRIKGGPSAQRRSWCVCAARPPHPLSSGAGNR